MPVPVFPLRSDPVPGFGGSRLTAEEEAGGSGRDVGNVGTDKDLPVFREDRTESRNCSVLGHNQLTRR